MPGKTAPAESRDFAAAVVRWQKKYGRHNLPWQADAAPYHVWLSEIMLQQTQAAAVIPYYQKFIRRWPDIGALARARTETVMAAWSGLGYYARARNLHAAAKIIRREGIPQSAEEWRRLPGVGRSTAAAVAVFSLQERAAILDGNVKRVLARFFAVQTPLNAPGAEDILWARAESLLPERKHIRAYTQGMMDLGAMVCVRKNPRCGVCPLSEKCAAKRRGIADILPHRMPPKQKPQKTAVLALVVYGGFVFAEKRPPRGIWGGLRSLPEGRTAAALKRRCEMRLGVKLILRGAGEFSHAFTHYRLHARVLTWECAAPSAPAPGENGIWLSRAAAANAALPAPVKKYILEYGFGGK